MTDSFISLAASFHGGYLIDAKRHALARVNKILRIAKNFPIPEED